MSKGSLIIDKGLSSNTLLSRENVIHIKGCSHLTEQSHELISLMRRSSVATGAWLTFLAIALYLTFQTAIVEHLLQTVFLRPLFDILCTLPPERYWASIGTILSV